MQLSMFPTFFPADPVPLEVETPVAPAETPAETPTAASASATPPAGVPTPAAGGGGALPRPGGAKPHPRTEARAPLACDPGGAAKRDPGGAADEDARRQLPLFSEWTALAGALDLALTRADFATARDAAERMRTTYGPSSVPRWAAALEKIADDVWDRGDPAAALSAWRHVDARLPSAQRNVLRRGVFARVFAAHAPEDVVARDGSALGACANALFELGEPARARRLVRDALLAGRDVPEIDRDPALADLLSEDLGPPFLAALGAIRRIWPLPLPDAAERAALAAQLEDPVPADDVARARAFWDALRLAECRSALPEPLLHATRRRLKRLHPDLHAAYMHRGGPFA